MTCTNTHAVRTLDPLLHSGRIDPSASSDSPLILVSIARSISRSIAGSIPRSIPRSAPRSIPGSIAGSIAILLCALGLALPAAAQTRPQGRLPSTPITAGVHLIDAELAITEPQQATGMMYRTRMGTNEGMLFVNKEPGLRCFWMRNTLLPLSIAFVEDDGTIVNIAEMQPQSDVSHCSTRPVRFALEMNSGWFAKRGLQAGFKLRGKPFTP